MTVLRFDLIYLLLLLTASIANDPQTIRAQEDEPSIVYPRIGYSVSAGSDLSSRAIQSMRAGSYVNWGTHENPRRPNGMEFIQMVRLHQNLTCGIGSDLAWDRERCPYTEPHDYTATPTLDEIGAIARANPGSIWLVGNEMDRRDWHGGRQDEMLPELYARAYHDVCAAIKTADPAARVAIGGVIQATPLRLQYLDQVWDSYREQFGAEMPVDVWNVHNFILREVHQEYGADIPPGLPPNSPYAVVHASDWTHINRALFEQQIRAFRRWMAARGQQEKPLIISEYGVLYRHCVKWRWTGSEWTCDLDFNDEEVVIDFMLDTFDFFLNEKDCSIGYVADDCRLVQRWLWFSLDYNADEFNPHGRFYDPQIDELTPAGEAFRDWVNANREALSDPLPGAIESNIYAPRVTVEENQIMNENDPRFPSQEEIERIRASVEPSEDGSPVTVRTLTPLTEMNPRQQAAWMKRRLEFPHELSADEEDVIRSLLTSLELSPEEKEAIQVLYQSHLDEQDQ